MTITPLHIAVAFVSLIAAAAFAAWWWQPARRQQRKLNRTIRTISREVMRDIVIPDGVDGEIHIDYLLLTGHGLLVLDIKHVNGSVFGSGHTDIWTAIDDGKRVAFSNPMGALSQRVIALRSMNEHLPVDGRVVIIGNAELSKDLPSEVTSLDALREEFAASREADRAVIDSIYPQWADLRRRAA